jgi:ESCRT-II complex subunit VPS25
MEHSLQLTDYKFPDYFDWPFFFTIQRHAETRIKQLSMWADMIISFCRDNKLWRLSRSEFIKYMGSNTKINR